MKTQKARLSVCFGMAVLISNVILFAEPMSTAFTYQGRLLDDNIAADGVYDFEFTLHYNDPNGGIPGIEVLTTFDDIQVVDGYFTVELDYSSNNFNGDARWLEIAVRPGESTEPNDFVTLSPPSEITSTPYALYALRTRGISVDDDLNVGIGAEFPTTKLEAAGTIYSNTGGFKFPDGTTQTTASQGDGHSLDAADGDPVDAVYVDNDGDVGIGTQTPSSRLDIGSTSDVGNSIRIASNNSGSIVFYDAGSTACGGLTYAHTNNSLTFTTENPGGGNSIKMAIDSDGNVGIGDQYPLAKLEVAGTIYSNTGGFKFPDNTTQTTASSGDGHSLDAADGDPVDAVYVDNDGMVGIGNQDPYYRLDLGVPEDSVNYLRIGSQNWGGVLFYDGEDLGSGGIKYSHSADTLQFDTRDPGGSSSTKVIVKSGGNVGIGTVNPTNLLEVAGTIEAENIGIGTPSPEAMLHVKNKSTTDHFQLKIANPYAAGANAGHAGILFHVEDDQVNRGKGGILYENVGYYNQGNMHFLQNNAADTSQASLSDSVMVIKNNGNVGIGTASPGSYKLYVNGTAYSTGGWNTSDSRYKQNVETITAPLEKVMSIDGVSFEWKTSDFQDKGFPEGRHFGVIAQDIERTLPEVVKAGPQGDKAVSYIEIVPILVEAVKEQQKQIETLQTELSRLNKKLENR
jgi:hypothetical protein